MSKLDVLGIKINNLTLAEALEKIEKFLMSAKQHHIVLPYSEFIIRARKDKDFKKILNEASLSLCESRGLWLAARVMGKKFKESIAGVDLICKIAKAKHYKQKIFLLGGEEGLARKVKEKLGEQVVGYENGYQGLKKVIDLVNKTEANILLVGIGSPAQEKWIYQNLEKMPKIRVAVGVGGAFDFISGAIKRAPKGFQKTGLEWLWRLIWQPQRISRIIKGVGGLLLLVIHTRFVKD